MAGRAGVRNTTRAGLGAAAQRRWLMAGGLAVVIVACFLGSGLLVDQTVMAELNRPVKFSRSAAFSMRASLDALQAQPADTPFELAFTETALNAYWELIVGPQVGLKPGTGAVRLLSGNRVLLAGQFVAAGGFKILVVVAPRVDVPGQLFQVDSAAIQIVPVGNTRLGWLPVPVAVLQSLVDGANSLFQARVELTGSSVAGSALKVSGVIH